MEVPDCLIPSLHYLEKAVCFLFKKKKKKTWERLKGQRENSPGLQVSSEINPYPDIFPWVL